MPRPTLKIRVRYCVLGCLVAASLAVSVFVRPAATDAPSPSPNPTALSAVGQPSLEEWARAARRGSMAELDPAYPAAEPPAIQKDRRVGIQAGHWLAESAPDELAAVRETPSARGGGWDEEDVTLQVAERVAAILEGEGIEVDILPATVPEGYEADLFLALHADAWIDPAMRGFKIARSAWSRDPDLDDSLVQMLAAEYQEATGLPEHPFTVTDNMTEYYAFNHAKFGHAISPTTSAAIIEMGFLTNAGDLEVLTQAQESVASGIARAILRFLEGSPPEPRS